MVCEQHVECQKIFTITIPKHNTNCRNISCHATKIIRLIWADISLTGSIAEQNMCLEVLALSQQLVLSTINTVHWFCNQSQWYSTYKPSSVDFDPFLGAALHSFYEVFSDSAASIIVRSLPRQRDITTLSVIYQQAGRCVRCVWERKITQDR